MSDLQIDLDMSDFRDMDLEYAQDVEIDKVIHLLKSHNPQKREKGQALLDKALKRSEYLYDNDRDAWEELYK
jgi:hypothetical protein